MPKKCQVFPKMPEDGQQLAMLGSGYLDAIA